VLLRCLSFVDSLRVVVPYTDCQHSSSYFFFAAGFFAFGVAFLVAAFFVVCFAGIIFPPYNVLFNLFLIFVNKKL
jgi:hypothetical protein